MIVPQIKIHIINLMLIIILMIMVAIFIAIIFILFVVVSSIIVLVFIIRVMIWFGYFLYIFDSFLNFLLTLLLLALVFLISSCRIILFVVILLFIISTLRVILTIIIIISWIIVWLLFFFINILSLIALYLVFILNSNWFIIFLCKIDRLLSSRCFVYEITKKNIIRLLFQGKYAILNLKHIELILDSHWMHVTQKIYRKCILEWYQIIFHWQFSMAFGTNIEITLTIRIAIFGNQSRQNTTQITDKIGLRIFAAFQHMTERALTFSAWNLPAVKAKSNQLLFSFAAFQAERYTRSSLQAKRALIFIQSLTLQLTFTIQQNSYIWSHEDKSMSQGALVFFSMLKLKFIVLRNIFAGQAVSFKLLLVFKNRLTFFWIIRTSKVNVQTRNLLQPQMLCLAFCASEANHLSFGCTLCTVCLMTGILASDTFQFNVMAN